MSANRPRIPGQGSATATSGAPSRASTIAQPSVQARLEARLRDLSLSDGPATRAAPAASGASSSSSIPRRGGVLVDVGDVFGSSSSPSVSPGPSADSGMNATRASATSHSRAAVSSSSSSALPTTAPLRRPSGSGISSAAPTRSCLASRNSYQSTGQVAGSRFSSGAARASHFSPSFEPSSRGLSRDSPNPTNGVPDAGAVAAALRHRISAAKTSGKLNLRELNLPVFPTVAIQLGAAYPSEELTVGTSSRSMSRGSGPRNTTVMPGGGEEKLGWEAQEEKFDRELTAAMERLEAKGADKRDEIGWWEANEITHIDASMNQIRRLPALLGVSFGPSLVSLVLDGCLLGTQPPTLPGIPSVESPALAFPDDFFTPLQNLRTVSLRDNQLTSLPSSLARLPSLVELNLDGNRLTALPYCLAFSPSLRILTASRNELRCVFEPPTDDERISPGSTLSARNLIKLKLDNNRLETDGLYVYAGPDQRPVSYISNLIQCTELNLSNNRLSNRVPFPSLAPLASLAVLNISYNQFSTLPELPDEYNGRACALKELYAAHNQLEDVSALCAQTSENGLSNSLTLIYLNDNRLATLPDDLGSKLPLLQTLELGNNDLSDLPISLGLLPNLARVVLDGNPLRRIPPHRRNAGIQALKTWLKSRLNPEEAENAEEKVEHRSRQNTTKALAEAKSASETRQRVAPKIGSRVGELNFEDTVEKDTDPSPATAALLATCEPWVITALREGAGERKVDFSGRSLRAVPKELTELGEAVAGPLGLWTGLVSLSLARNELGADPAGPPASTAVSVGGRARLMPVGARRITDQSQGTVMSRGGTSGGVTPAPGVTPCSAYSLRVLDSLSITPFALQSLVELDLSGNALRTLPRGITALSQLRRLSLRGNHLTMQSFRFCSDTGTPIAPLLSSLPYLEELDLRNNLLSDFNLRLLCLDHCTHVVPPSGARSLEDLEALPTYYQYSERVRMHLRLRVLLLSYNKLTALPAGSLALFPELTDLDVSNNQIEAIDATNELPTPNSPHDALQSFDLSNNNLQNLPLELGSRKRFPSLRALHVSGNPLRTVRPAVVAQGPAAVLAYLATRLPDGFDDE